MFTTGIAGSSGCRHGLQPVYKPFDRDTFQSQLLLRTFPDTGPDRHVHCTVGNVEVAGHGHECQRGNPGSQPYAAADISPVRRPSFNVERSYGECPQSFSGSAQHPVEIRYGNILCRVVNADLKYGIRRIEEAFEEESHYQDEAEPTVKATVLTITFQHALPKRFLEDLFPDADIRPVIFGGINASIIELRGTNLSVLQLALNSCVMLSTYLDHYFIPMGLLQKYSIFCLAEDQQVTESFEVGQLANFIPGSGEFPLVIDDNIFNHTDAKSMLKSQKYLQRDAYGFIDYDVEYSNVAKTIDNIVKEQE